MNFTDYYAEGLGNPYLLKPNIRQKIQIMYSFLKRTSFFANKVI